MESEEARDLKRTITLPCSANPSGSRNFLSEVWDGFQEVRSQGVHTQAKAIGVSLNPDAASLTHTPVIPALGKLRQKNHTFEPSLGYMQRL